MTETLWRVMGQGLHGEAVGMGGNGMVGGGVSGGVRSSPRQGRSTLASCGIDEFAAEDPVGSVELGECFDDWNP